MSLEGKTVFITGASRGIGRAIALRCARDGANVVIAAKTSAPHPTLAGTVHSVAQEVEAAGGHGLALVVDVRNEAVVQDAMARAADTFGGIDALVNNAGAISLTGTRQTPLKRVDLMLGVNVRATFLCAQTAIPYLEKAANPHIVNLSPPIDLAERWLKGHVAYTISKYGMTLCTLGMSAELRRAGIAVNSLWPRTIIATDALRVVGGSRLEAQARTPEIMADACYAILTSPSREVTGNCFLDEPLLRSHGVEDFSGYAVTPGTTPLTDMFVTE